MVTESEFVKLFQKWDYILGYNLKYIHLKSKSAFISRHYSLDKLKALVIPEINRMLFPLQLDYIYNQIFGSMEYHSVYHNKELMKELRFNRLIALNHKLFNIYQISNKGNQFFAINCKTGKTTTQNIKMRIIL